MEVFKKGWQGEERLVKVWWIVPIVTTIIMLTFFLTVAFIIPIEVFFAYSILVWATILPFILWFYVAAWRCAFNVNHQLWGYVARTVLCISILDFGIGLVQIGWTLTSV